MLETPQSAFSDIHASSNAVRIAFSIFRAGMPLLQPTPAHTMRGTIRKVFPFWESLRRIVKIASESSFSHTVLSSRSSIPQCTTDSSAFPKAVSESSFSHTVLSSRSSMPQCIPGQQVLPRIHVFLLSASRHSLTITCSGTSPEIGKSLAITISSPARIFDETAFIRPGFSTTHPCILAHASTEKAWARSVAVVMTGSAPVRRAMRRARSFAPPR